MIKRFGTENPTDDNNVSTLKKFTSELIAINVAVKEKNFMEAYRILDTLRFRAKTAGYTDEDRQYVRAKLDSVIKEQYRDQIVTLYKTKIEQYKRMNDDSIEFFRGVEGYPKARWQTQKAYEEGYYKKKAVDEINDALRTTRYGAYMHKIVNDVITEFEENIKLQEEFDKAIEAKKANSQKAMGANNTGSVKSVGVNVPFKQEIVRDDR